jgi:hypothetical protein
MMDDMRRTTRIAVHQDRHILQKMVPAPVPLAMSRYSLLR